MQVESMDYGIKDTSDIESILLDTTWYVPCLPHNAATLNRRHRTAINENDARAASERVVNLFTIES